MLDVRNPINVAKIFRFAGMLIIIGLLGAAPSEVHSKEVCTFIQILGQVFHLKGNKPPELGAKLREGAELGDGIHTMEASRAHLRFIDTSDVIIAPKSKIVIEAYMCDTPTTTERLVSLVTRGLVHALVNWHDKNNLPEFIIKTNTAMATVRGTDFYILIGRNFTDILVKSGKVAVKSNLYAKIEPKELQRLYKQISTRSGPGSTSLVEAYKACRIMEGWAASKCVRLTPQDFEKLEKLMISGLPEKFREGDNPKQLLDLLGPISP